MAKKSEDIVKKTISELFTLLGIDDSFEIEEKEETINVTLNTEQGGMIIGYHGETLDALQLIASLCVSKKIGKFVHVSIEVGDYKKNREEFLIGLANRTKEKVVFEGREMVLSNLKPWERRIIHMYLQEDKDVVSESDGEGRDRVLVIKPR